MKLFLTLLIITFSLNASKIDIVTKGKELYINSKCFNCHGNNGEKKPFGKVNAIAGMSKVKIKEALIGYKLGKRNNYGFGGLMKGQVSSYSDEEIEAIANFVSSLNSKKLR